MARALKWIALAFAGLILLFALLLAVTPQGRAVAKTVGLVAQVLPEAPVHPLGLLTSDPERTQIMYPVPAGQNPADIYRMPGGGPKPAIVLFLGVSPAGRNDPRVVNLANALARTGFIVFVPWSQDMMNGIVEPSDVGLLVSAFQYVKTLPGVDPKRIGGAGFSVGASLMVIAAADSRMRNEVRFINFFAGYYDVRDYLAEVSSHEAFYKGSTRPWDPNPLTVEVFTRLLIDGLPSSAERAVLNAHFVNGDPITPQQVEALSPGAAAVYHLLSGTTLDEARRLILELPEPMLKKMDELSPSRYVDSLRADLWIMHDRSDTLEPVEESRRLYDATKAHGNVDFTELSSFQHVDPKSDLGFFGFATQSWKLFLQLYRVERVTT